MIFPCPNCGSQSKDDEPVCGSCGWDPAVPKNSPLPEVWTPPSRESVPFVPRPGSVPLRTAEAPPYRSGSSLSLAVMAAAAIGTVSLLALYLHLRQEIPSNRHPGGGPPFAVRSSTTVPGAGDR